MKPYINEGLVEILDWNLKPLVFSGTDRYEGQFSVINDCIYHNMYRVKYLALMDMDEFIIPQHKNHFKITDMLLLDLLRDCANALVDSNVED